MLEYWINGILETRERDRMAGLPRIILKAPVFRLGMKAISNLKIKKSPVL